MSHPRGEIRVTVAGRERTLVPSFAALVAIETRTGKSVTEIVDGIRTLRFRATELATVVHCGLGRADAAGEFVEPEETMQQIGEAMVRSGSLMEWIEPVCDFLGAIVAGGAEAEEIAAAKKKPRPRKKTSGRRS